VEPATGLFLILAMSALNGVIASKRNRSGFGFFALSVAPVFPLVWIAASLSHGDGNTMGWAAFLPPIAVLIAAIVVPNGKEAAVRTGSHGSFVKCQFCAEPVRREAIKCKHCGSDLIVKPTASILNDGQSSPTRM
jgi:DNA-directed RNA polymerase subunit RPC12/RpoP